MSTINAGESEGRKFIVSVRAKPTRIWVQPEVLMGLRNGGTNTKKQQTYARICEELNKFGCNRDNAECRRKIKNMRTAYQKAKSDGTLDSWRFKDVMEKVLRLEKAVAQAQEELLGQEVESPQNPGDDKEEEKEGDDFTFDFVDDSMATYPDNTNGAAGTQNITFSTDNQMNGLMSHPVEIEFELMDLVKGQMPVEIEGGSIVVPQEFANDVGITDAVYSTEPKILRPSSIATSTTTTDAAATSTTSEINDNIPVSTCPNPKRTYAQQNIQEVLQKRRKLQTLQDKMNESVARVLAQSTNSLIEEMKKSEERFIKWEEERREKDRLQEERMLKQLLAGIKTGEKGGKPQTAPETSETDDDSGISGNFDSIATNLVNKVTEEARDMEESFLEWEKRMQRKEQSHTENLFKLIMSAVSNSSSK